MKAIDENTARPANLTSTPYNYKYNGQEFQDELGLNMYDMDMRQYDPAIARWVVLDPVIHHSMSPYNAFDNNLVFWADPSGADSVFDQGGVSASSITVMGSGMEIGAGGAESSSGGEEGAKAASAKDPGKKSWFGRMLGKIGKLFGGGGKATGGTVNQGIDVLGITDDVDTNTITNSTSFPENPLFELNHEGSETTGESGVFSKDRETVTDVNSPTNNQIKTNYQFNSLILNASAYGGTSGEGGVSLQQSFGGLAGISVTSSISITNPQHSSIGFRLHENINLNNKSSSIGGGIKPLGIISAVATRFIIRMLPPGVFTNPNPTSLVPPTTMSTTK